ncbi:MAG: DUF4215 domain-containing protein [Polyangiaceae bacterium]
MRAFIVSVCAIAVGCSARSSLLPYENTAGDGGTGAGTSSDGGAGATDPSGGSTNGGFGQGGFDPTGGAGGALPVCGNGVVEGNEPCDDGNTSNGDDCLSGCALPYCGDGFLHQGVEDCDDGNTQSGDTCPADCHFGPAVCGNGVLEGDEICDLGDQNEDRWGLAYRQGNGPFSPLSPLDNNGSAVNHYSYSSASSHTGFEALNGSRIYFYRNRNNGVLSLIFHHGIDQDSSGLSQPQSHVRFSFNDLPMGTFVGLSDDNGELNPMGSSMYGDWQFQNNSDGGLIAGFPLPGDWLINVEPQFFEGIDEWQLATLGVSFDLNTPVEFRAESTPSKCRTDCTVPTCGDGLLDAGELCDDGNNASGDGCSADCNALF